MKKLSFFLFLLIAPLFAKANYYGSQITYEYSESTNKVIVTAKYWRVCNASIDPTLSTIRVEAPGCGTINIPVTSTTITDISLYKDRYPNLACVIPNRNNYVKGLEEFVSVASIDIDTLKAFANNGCCKIYFSEQIGFSRPSVITTGVGGLHYNYAMLDICNLMAAKNEKKEFKSANFLMPIYTQKLFMNQPAYIDFAGYGNGDDSLSYILAPALGNTRTNTLTPSAPLTSASPMTTYCLPGTTAPCIPIPTADPPIGFGLDNKTGAIAFTPSKANEVGVAVIHINQWVKDTLGIPKLVGIVRRDFVMAVHNGDKNNPPRIKGCNDVYALPGDSLLLEFATSDIQVIAPPPAILRAPDTTSILFKSSHDDVKFSLKDSTIRERVGIAKLAVDSTHLGISPIVIAAMVYDQDSLLPANSMCSNRIYIYVKDWTSILKLELFLVVICR